MITNDQITQANLASVDTLFGLSSKAFEGVERLVELNVQAAKASMGEFSETVHAALAVKSPQELLALQASLVKPAAEKAAAYGRHVQDIVTSTGADLRAAVQAQIADAQQKFNDAFETALKNAPAGSENAVALMKSTLAQAGKAYESVGKAAAQVTEAVDAKFSEITETVAKNARGAKAASAE